MANKKSKDEEVDEEEEGGGKGGKIKFVVIGLVALGAIYNFVLKPAPEETEMLAEPMEVELIEGEIFQMEEMVLNLEDPDVGYLRIGLAVVLEEGVLAADFEMESAIARDVAVTFLSAQTVEDLRSATGKVEIKEELSMLMREAYGDEKVIRVLFTGLVMQ